MRSNDIADALMELEIRFSRALDAKATSESRGGLLPQQGDADVAMKTLVSASVADDFRKLARSLGISCSELLRVLIVSRTYGVEHVVSITSEQIRQACMGVPKGAQNDSSQTNL